MRKFCLVKSHIFKTEQLEKMPVKGLYENREFHGPFWSMIYVNLKSNSTPMSVSEIDEKKFKKFNFNSK